jgi:hypothetical protein
LKSLKELGYSPVVHAEGGVILKNSYSSTKAKVHISIPKSQFNGVYGDLGFEKTKKGFTMHADHIDLRKFNMKGLNTTYSENKVKKYVATTSRCNITSRKINSKGQVEIKLRMQN